MNRNQVIARVRPQLVRKRSQVVLPTNVAVVIRPSRAQVATLKELKAGVVTPLPATPKPVITPPAPKSSKNRQAIPAKAAVAKALLQKRAKVRKQADVKYITRNNSPESAARIGQLRNRGQGRLLLVIGNGPSLIEAALDQLRNQPLIDTLTVNKPDQRLWPTTYWSFFDNSQYRRHEDLWHGYTGHIFNSTAIKRQKETSMQFKNLGGKGWSRDLIRGLHIGRSSVFASMQIAAWLGYEHVYLFGVDMNPAGLNGQLHFYGVNPDVAPDVRKDRFQKEASFYDHAAEIMTPAERAKFTFCSTYNFWPFIDKFRRLDHRIAHAHILQHATNLAA